MSKGKNGQQIAQENVTKVETWINERKKLRDWYEYKGQNNRVNRKALAEELDFARSVTTQNVVVRKLLDSADVLWFQHEEVTKASQEASIERSQELLGKTASEKNKLAHRVAELEAENRQLRQELAAYKRQKSIIESGFPGFKL